MLGTGIALYGEIGPVSSPFFVTLDGSMPQIMAPNSEVNTSVNTPQILYIQNDLDPGPHTLVVRNNPDAAPQSSTASILNIHHAVVLDSVRYA